MPLCRMSGPATPHAHVRRGPALCVLAKALPPFAAPKMRRISRKILRLAAIGELRKSLGVAPEVGTPRATGDEDMRNAGDRGLRWGRDGLDRTGRMRRG